MTHETDEQLQTRLAPLLNLSNRAQRLQTFPAAWLCVDLGVQDVANDMRELGNSGVTVVNLAELVRLLAPHVVGPVPMLLVCPRCHEPHVDEGEWATRPHRTHLCAACGATFRPALVPTIGVVALTNGQTEYFCKQVTDAWREVSP